MDIKATMKRNVLLEDDTLHILPTFLRVEEEVTSALNKNECGVVFGKKIFTFPQLIERIFEEIKRNKTLLSLPGQLVLIEKVIDTIYKGKEDGYFKPLINSRTFSNTLINMINTLKIYDISSVAFDGIVKRWRGEDKERLMELASVYRYYHLKLEELELIDHNDMNIVVRDFVANKGNEIAFLNGVHNLKVEDIYDFTPVQFDLIIALAHRVEHTDVIIPYDHDRGDIFGYVERTIRKFESLWELNVDISLNFKTQRDDSQGKLSGITKNYFRSDGHSSGIEPISIDGELALIETTGIYQEAETIGKEISKLLDEGVKPGKIGVLFKDLSLYGEMIEDVFNRFKIPLYFRRGKPLLSSNVIKTILSIFELLDNNFERHTFLKIIRSNYIDFWQGEYSLDGGKMESYILKAGIIDDRGNGWDGKLTRLTERIDSKMESSGEEAYHSNTREEREEVKRLKNRVLYMKRDIEAFRKKNTVKGFIDILKRLIQNLGIPRKVLCCNDEDVLKRDIASLKKFDDILDELNNVIKQLVLDDETITYGYFRNLLMKFMEEGFILSGREFVHGVKVLNLYESRGLTFDYLFLCGLIEDSSPGKMWQDPLFKDDEKAQFNHMVGKKVFLLMEEKYEEEPLLFYLGLSCAQKRLYLSYSQVDAKGRTVLPSLYLDEVMRLVDKKNGFATGTSHGFIVPQLKECFEKEEIENRLSFNIWKASLSDGEKRDDNVIEEEVLTASLFNQLITHEQFRNSFKKIFQCAEVERIREQFFLEENIVSRKNKASIWTGLITNEEIRKELKGFFEEGKGRFWSPTHFESYVSCPFRFFLKRLLKVLPLKVPEEEIEIVDEGNLIHKVLERFFKERKEGELLPVTGSEEEKNFIKKVADEIYQQWEEKEYIGDRDLWEIRKKRLDPLWDRFIEEESKYRNEGFLPVYFEFLIGNLLGDEGDSDMPPLVVMGYDRKEILVGGKVDRVDIGPDRVRVIDYKNSGNEQFYRDLLKEEKMGVQSFQIPVYLAALKEFMSEQNKINLMEGTFYLFRKPKRMKPYVVGSSDHFFEKDLRERMKLREQGRVNLFNQISGIVEGAKSGDYSICPKDCNFCEYDHICRFVSVDIDEGEK